MGAIRKLTGNFVATPVDDELLIVDLHGGELFSLGGTARAIWDAIDGTRDEAQIVHHLAATYEADAATLAREVGVFLAELKTASLVAPSD